MHAGEFTQESAQAWTVAGGVGTGHVGLDDPSTAYTGGLVQQKMGDLHGDGGKLDHLLGMVKRRGGKLAMSTGTRRRIEVLHLGRLKPSRAGTRMSLSGAPFAR